jgi:hypothetical protein
VDVSDLANESLVQWAHRHYFLLAGIFGYIVPSLVPCLWDDFWVSGLSEEYGPVYSMKAYREAFVFLLHSG